MHFTRCWSEIIISSPISVIARFPAFSFADEQPFATGKMKKRKTEYKVEGYCGHISEIGRGGKEY